jgi:hypothetical protein
MWTLNGYTMLYIVYLVYHTLQCLSNSQFYAAWNNLVSFVANGYSGSESRSHSYVRHAWRDMQCYRNLESPNGVRKSSLKLIGFGGPLIGAPNQNHQKLFL